MLARMHPMYRSLLLNLFLALVLAACGQSTTNMRAVRVMADVDSATSTITLRWQELEGATGYTIYRRAAGATTWGAAIATLPGTALEYADASVDIGAGYEYKVQRSAEDTGYGYVRSGIAVPPVDYRGRVVLVVANGIADALETAIRQLENDLNADGWTVVRHDLTASATAVSVRALIQGDYNTAPQDVKAVYLLGHVPVAYMGAHAPDGHSYHSGAWPGDGYFGEMNGSWTDNSVTATGSSWAWNHNVPGDGKFDQSDFPSAVELQVGRVDLSRMNIFTESETELLEAYLDRAHAWKTAAFTVPQTAAVWDNLEWSNYPLATSGYLSAVPCVGIDAVVQLEPSQGQFHQRYLNYDDLFTYHGSTGLQQATSEGVIFPGTDNGLWDSLLVDNQHGGVFNLSVGSYYGDWDNTDNFLRAVIAKGNALAHMWSGMPNWYLHPMAMGEPIGYCAMRTMNNSNSDYSLQNGGWQGQSMEQSHMTLMGDPSLRMRYVAPPSELVATNEDWFVNFTWTPSPAQVNGYHIYRIDDVAGTIVRITPEPVQGTAFTSTTVPFVPGDRYMVRALQLVTTASGSYYDLSLGALAIAEGQAIADCEGVLGGPAIPGTACDDGDAQTSGELYDLSCECVAGPIGIGENTGADALVLWPSPADQELRLTAHTPGGMYIVRSLDGAEVMSGRVTAKAHLIATDALPVGSYVLEYRAAGTGPVVNRRFVVTH